MKKAMAIYALLLAILFSGCSPTEKYPRKKLPDMPESDETTPVKTERSIRKQLMDPVNELLDLCAPAFNMRGEKQDAHEQASYNISETRIAGKSYYSIQIFHGANDSSLLDLVKFYRPFAGSIIGMLLNNGSEGALIDFSMPGAANTERVEYLVKNTKGQSFTVIFIYDRPGAGRALQFINELQQLPGIESTQIDSNNNY